MTGHNTLHQLVTLSGVLREAIGTADLSTASFAAQDKKETVDALAASPMISKTLKDVDDALDLIAHGKFPDDGHLNEYSQRVTPINCGCDMVTGAAAALIQQAQHDVHALGDALNQLMTALSSDQFLASLLAAARVLAISGLLLALAAAIAAAPAA